MQFLSESFTSATAGTKSDLGGRFAVSVSGTFVATIELQRSFDGGTTWGEVWTFTAPDEINIDEPAKGVEYRFECTAYTSGTAVCRADQ